MCIRDRLTEDESTGTTEQQTEETAGDADGTRAVQDQADDVENSLEPVSYTHLAWLSSARVVRCWVKSRNERNPYPQ